MRGLPIHDAAALTRSELDRLNEQARRSARRGSPGCASPTTEPGSRRSRSSSPTTSRRRSAKRAGLRPGSVILFGADREKVVCDVLGRLRLELGQKLGRYDGRAWDPHFVVGFPLFEEGDDGKLTYMHMPFVAPLESEIEKLDTRSEERDRDPLRPGDERRRARLGQPAQPPLRRAAQDPRDHGLQRGGGARALRLHARRARHRRAAARRLRVRLRSARADARRRREPARRDRVPQDPARAGQLHGVAERESTPAS